MLSKKAKGMLVNSSLTIWRLLARFPLLEKDMISNHEDVYFLVSCFGDDSWRFGEGNSWQGIIIHEKC